MKTGIHILLATLFLYQAFSTTYILLSFELNREKIAKTLCVKKEEPDNCCQGSCHLKKQLQAEEKKQQNPVRSFKQVKQFPLFYQPSVSLSFKSILLRETDFLPYHCSETTPPSASVFHPPCC